MDSSKFPEGWMRCKLADVLNRSDEKWNPEDGGDHRYLSLKHIEKDTGRIVGHGNSSEVDSAKNIFYEGDVLYGKLRPYLNKVAQPSFDGVCSTDILVFSSSPAIDSGFLKHRLRATDVVQYADRRSSGINLPRISPDDLGEFEIALPPLAEQRRIADRLDAIQSHAQKARETMANAPSSIDEYRQSVLNAALIGQLTTGWRKQHPDIESGSELVNTLREERREFWEEQYRWERYDSRDKTPPSGWKSRFKELDQPDPSSHRDIPDSWTWVQVQQAGEVQLGRQRSPEYHEGDNMCPYLRVANVFEDRIDTSDVKEMHFSERDFQKYKLEEGDILLNEGQSRELVGRPAMFRGEVSGACFQNTLIRFRGYNSVSRNFALIVFRAYLHNGRFADVAHQTTSVAHLGSTRFSKMPFPLPPLAEQEEIARRVGQRLEKIDQMARHVKQAHERLDHLDRSVLAKAFRGELVETEAERARREGRDYETAEELLARVSEDGVSSDRAKASKQPSNGRQLEMDM